MSKSRRGSFRGKVSRNVAQQKSKASNHAHLLLPKGVPMFKEEAEGEGSRVEMDILPYEVTDPKHPDRDDDTDQATVGSLWYKRPYKLHRTVGTDNKTIICPGSIGRPCPICEHRASLVEQGADWKDDSVRALRPSPRNLYCVRPLTSRKFEKIPHIWDISQFCFQEKLNNEIEEDDSLEEFPDLETGKTLKIRFTESKVGKNKFAETDRIDFVDRPHKYAESILDEVPALDEILDIKTYEEVERMFFESEPGDAAGAPTENTDEDDPPRRETRETRRTPTSTRSSRSREPEAAETVVRSTSRGRDRDEAPARHREPETVGARARVPAEGQDDDPPARSRPSRPATEPEPDENPCPSGYRFGVDTDDKPECGECKVWDECMDARDKKK